MPRISRQKSASGYYHVILRGVNRQDIFFDDEDRERMLNCLKRFHEETGVLISAYCLMSNHIHLLINAPSGLDAFVKKVASSYVYYFNRKYDRVGHLFQDRFRSEPVDTDEYLLAVYRYILQNPAKAGLCKPEEYPWSSWGAMDGIPNFCSIETLLEIAGSDAALKDFVLQKNEDECLDADTIHPLTEKEALREIQRVTGETDPQKIAGYSKKERNEIVQRLKAKGLSVRQISRLTGLNRNIIQRA